MSSKEDQATDELYQLRRANAALSGEISLLTRQQGILMNGMVACQGSLSQFLRGEVQNAFMCGRFEIPTNTWPILQSLDAMRRVVLPYPVAPGEKSVGDSRVVEFVTLLLSRDSG